MACIPGTPFAFKLFRLANWLSGIEIFEIVLREKIDDTSKCFVELVRVVRHRRS